MPSLCAFLLNDASFLGENIKKSLFFVYFYFLK